MKSWLLSFLLLVTSVSSTTVHRRLDDSRGQIDLVDLVPFDVQMALTEDRGIQTFEVTDIVTSWLNESFRRRLAAMGYSTDSKYASFDSVILLEHSNKNRNLQVEEEDTPLGVLYTARFEGVALFTRDEVRPFKVPPGDVLEIQHLAVKEDDSLLLQALIDSNAVGLGDPVVAVNAFLSPTRSTENDDGDDDDDDQLQLVIIIAVCVACVAFVCLVVAIAWAWKNERQNRAAYRVEAANNNTATKGKAPSSSDQDRTGSDTTADDVGSPESKNAAPYLPSEVYGSRKYDESIISEDISTSLSAYYRGGLSSGLDFVRRAPAADAVSVSSMESYGYSLDGRSYTVESMRENSGGLGSGGAALEEPDELAEIKEPQEPVDP